MILQKKHKFTKKEKWNKKKSIIFSKLKENQNYIL